MNALFFGSSNRQLFGVYHPPRAQHARDMGVLFAYPGVQEYNAAHWAFRKLAAMLARDGFPVLRFDWHGTGDSAGRVEDGHPDAWIEDLTVAAQELRDSSGAQNIAILGMRLGATLAMTACARGLEAKRLILWEPVVSGAKYITELEAQDERENFHLMHAVPRVRDELVGYPVTRAFRDAVTRIDAYAISPSRAEKIAIFAATPRPDYVALKDALARGGRDVAFFDVPEDEAVTAAVVREQALLSNKILLAMSAYLAGRAMPAPAAGAHAGAP